ncbi:MAG: Flp family type IVb pilin [Rhizobiales bacterium]|jgi:Flp pilus assembly pilin Flp|nr:Flp family type IVb pilin [Hyphomicrobiales bacterium]
MPPFHILRAEVGRTLTRFCADESGATAIEYALIASGVGGVVAATVWNLGETMKTLFYEKIKVTP